ncbi:Tripeptidyl aminopeptidase precursor [Actinomadura rubteroloni]|uniref:Tripeptidyl aminopeptidase n=1 Tax=Actinomadura rubteroloni TaxID=1926885 RepID=A0A2P4UHE7_9ACTN|nr:alpha/beta hydrolase [Actinomadura rubteroloni]POM24482.1 Tripeptidyl aminopeptidase precursor [Actinomadura rubteroloni]
MLTTLGKGALGGAAACLAAATLTSSLPAREGTAAAGAPPAVAWAPCPNQDPVEGTRLRGLDCGTLRVPLDHARPGGTMITLALTRLRHTAARSQGVVLLNRGGPGAHGRDMPADFRVAFAPDVVAAYDWIGFDPRGVGASRPALVCDTSYLNPGRPRADTRPASTAEENAWRARARAYARDCGRRYARYLPHLGTADWVGDMDAIRAALGASRVNYFGYSYGSYLGAVYASRYPGRVGRFVLDSVVKPSGVWYADNLGQNVAFEKRIRQYFAWIARNRSVYRLGGDAEAVRASYEKARARLKARPAFGLVGPSELDDLFLNDGYTQTTWSRHAHALADYLRGDTSGLRREWKPPSRLDQNNFAVYTATQCRDAAWPRDWRVWHRDSVRQFRQGYRFETWGNTWYNAPCAYWPLTGGPAPAVGGTAAPLLVQASDDAATPYDGAVETHERFPNSRLLVQAGGGDHGVTLGGDRCVDGVVAAYLRDGTLPPAGPGVDATCTAGPPPAASRAVAH